MNTKPSFAAVTNLLNNLNEQELAALVNNPKKLKELAASLVVEDVQNTYFIPIADKDVPQNLKESAVKWRKLASDLGYTGPVVWRVREGFTLKDHAPKAGPCYEAFEYLKSCNLKNDEATKAVHVFFIPRLVDKSTSKTVDEQMALLVETRKRYDLPEHHLSNFGSAAMLSGLVLAHLKRTGDKSSLDRQVVRTDTFRGDGGRLDLDFNGAALFCGSWHWGDDRNDDLGVFPLGVEIG